MKILNLKENGKGYSTEYAATILDYLYFIEGESPIHLIMDNFDVVVDDAFMSDVKNVSKYRRTDDIDLKLVKVERNEPENVHKQYYVFAIDTSNPYRKHKIYDKASETWVDVESIKSLWPNIKKFLYSDYYEAKRAQNSIPKDVFDTIYDSMNTPNVDVGIIEFSDEDLAELR